MVFTQHPGKSSHPGSRIQMKMILSVSPVKHWNKTPKRGNGTGLPDAGSSVATRAVLTHRRVAVLDVAPQRRLAGQEHVPGVDPELSDAAHQGPDPSGAGVHGPVGGQAPQEHGSHGCLPDRTEKRGSLRWVLRCLWMTLSQAGRTPQGAYRGPVSLSSWTQRGSARERATSKHYGAIRRPPPPGTSSRFN